VELQKKMIKRDPGSAPVTGDRVAYVYVSRGTKVFEKAEDPAYVLQHNIPIDVAYYLSNQLANPVVRIFEPIIGDKKRAYDSLFAGIETLTVKKEISHEKNSIFRHTVKVSVCLGCNTKSSKALCDHCESNRPSITQQRVQRLSEAQDKCNQLGMQCQTCQSSLLRKVICGATDCPIYYMRTKAARQLQEQQEAWIKLNASELF
jgi:DNA polymerase delta subunit 1